MKHVTGIAAGVMLTVLLGGGLALWWLMDRLDKALMMEDVRKAGL
jgi:hypothetical protein